MSAAPAAARPGRRPGPAGPGAAWLLVLALAPVLAPAPGRAAEEAPRVRTVASEEPRAFGYQVGEVMIRSHTIEVPPGHKIDADTLPQVGRQGPAFELRRVDWLHQQQGRYRLLLEYQVFLAPAEVRTLELPPLKLRFDGPPRAQDLRIDAWPVTVAPLVPVAVSPRRGLGEMQPDAEPPLMDTTAARQRLLAYAAAAGVMAVYLAHVYLGLPWLARRQRPFERAWRALHALPAAPVAAQQRAMLQVLHQAFNQSAGAVLFEQGIDAYLAAQPRYASLRHDLPRFFRLSRLAFFGGTAAAALGASDDPVPWLLDLCRRCRDAERGVA